MHFLSVKHEPMFIDVPGNQIFGMKTVICGFSSEGPANAIYYASPGMAALLMQYAYLLQMSKIKEILKWTC